MSSVPLRDKIIARRNTLKGTYLEVARFILESPAKVAFMTAEEAAENIGVSAASVVRFSQNLGYDGFHSLKKAIQQEIQMLVSPADRVEKSLSEIGDTPNALEVVVKTDMFYLEQLLSSISMDQFDQAVRAIASADRVGICGIRSVEALVDRFCLLLRRFKVDALAINNGGKSIFEQLHWLEKGDTLVTFAFLNPSSEVFLCLRYAKRVGATSVVITDLETSAAAPFADIILVGKRGPVGSYHSHLVPGAIMNGLVLAYARYTMPESLEALRNFQRIRTENTES